MCVQTMEESACLFIESINSVGDCDKHQAGYWPSEEKLLMWSTTSIILWI